MNGHLGNVYWSAGKAYQRSRISSSERDHSKQIEKCERRTPTEQLPKSRQRYHKCRFCSTLYSDPVLLDRHERTHFGLRKEQLYGGTPPPLVPVSSDSSNCHFIENNIHNKDRNQSPTSPAMFDVERDENGIADQSIVRKPIRNLLTKMFESERRSGDDEMIRSPEQESKKVMFEKDEQTHDMCPSPEYHKGMSRNQSPCENSSNELPNDELSGSYKPCKQEESRESFVFKCSICEETFEKKHNLDQHLIAHHKTEKFVCNVCSDIFIDKDVYKAHCLLHTTPKHICGFCKEVYDCPIAYENHLKSHSEKDKQFSCHICGHSFSVMTELRSHLLIHANVPPFICHICGKGYATSHNLSQHVKSVHRNRKHNGFEGKVLDTHLHSSYQEERSQSDIHDHKSPREMEHSPSRSSSASHDSSDLQRYEPIKMSRYYKDTHAYPYDSIPNRHIQTSPRSHNPLHYPHHTRNESDIMVHNHALRKMQSKESYNTGHRVTSLMTDQRSYSPIKPSPVKILPRPNPSQRQAPCFECLKCGERFTSPSLYDIHVQSHKEVFECEKCHKSFTSRSQYDSHVQTHDNNKSHKCPYCHRSFSMKGNLRRHIRIHTNEAPYECPICYQRFRRSDGLKGHIKRHETLGESAPTDLLPSQAS